MPAAPSTADPFAPVKAEAVARYLVLLAEAGDDGPASEPDCLTPLRLQKLLYYVQGWSLAMNGRPMFTDRIQAWKYGPVVRSVYDLFKDCKSGAIPGDAASSEGLSREQRDFIEQVWQAYKPYSAIALANMTHDEMPWKKARAGLGAEANGETEISLDDMREAFTKLMESPRNP